MTGIVETTWLRLKREMHERNATDTNVASAKAAFVAGLYAASCALNFEDARSRDVSEAAARLESTG